MVKYVAGAGSPFSTDACIIDQYVEGVRILLYFLYGSVDAFRVGDIERYAYEIVGIFLLKIVKKSPVIEIAACENEEAAGKELPADLKAEPSVGTCDKNCSFIHKNTR